MIEIKDDKISELRELMGDDFAILVTSYIEDTLSLLEQLQENIGKPIEADIRKVHSIKSTSLNMGASAVAELAQRLEQQLKGGGALAQEDWQNLSHLFEVTAHQMREMIS